MIEGTLLRCSQIFFADLLSFRVARLQRRTQAEIHSQGEVDYLFPLREQSHTPSDIRAQPERRGPDRVHDVNRLKRRVCHAPTHAAAVWRRARIKASLLDGAPQSRQPSATVSGDMSPLS